jgi:hypothetical protein
MLKDSSSFSSANRHITAAACASDDRQQKAGISDQMHMRARKKQIRKGFDTLIGWCLPSQMVEDATKQIIAVGRRENSKHSVKQMPLFTQGVKERRKRVKSKER